MGTKVTMSKPLIKFRVVETITLVWECEAVDERSAIAKYQDEVMHNIPAYEDLHECGESSIEAHDISDEDESL